MSVKSKPELTSLPEVLSEEQLAQINAYDFLGRDFEAEENGAWFGVRNIEGNVSEELKLKMRALSTERSKIYSAVKEKLEKEHKANVGTKPTEKDISRFAMEALWEAGVVLDWAGFKLGEQDLPFKYARQVLISPKYDYLGSFVLDTVLRASKFRHAAKEAALKN
jgi:hypothetical protein